MTMESQLDSISNRLEALGSDFAASQDQIEETRSRLAVDRSELESLLGRIHVELETIEAQERWTGVMYNELQNS
jgi:hypothetical protein